MKRFKVITYVAILTMTISSTAFAGTIVGARTNRTGTIVGARSGNIAGTRSGNIAGTRTGNIDPGSLGRNGSEIKLGVSSLISENIDGILRLFLTRTLF
jgi:hypothetical protein